MKCALEHLTKDCPEKNLTTPTCINCRGPHPASYRGCPRNPQNLRKSNTKKPTNNGIIPSNAANLLSHYNYTLPKTNKPDNVSTQNKVPDKANYISVKQMKNVSEINANASTSARSENSNETTSPELTENIMSDCTSGLNEIFGAFKEVKEILNVGKFITFFRKISTLTKSCKTPFQKLIVLIDHLDSLISDLNLNHDE